MRKFLLLMLLAFTFSTLKSQSLRKVSGVKYLGASYGYQVNGFNTNIHFDGYLKKNFAYSLQLTYENYSEDNFKLNDFYLTAGGKYFFSLPVKNLFFGGFLGSYFGKQYANHTILNDNLESWILGINFSPTLEYYIISEFSIYFNYSQFFDFRNDFRNYHFSFNLGIAYQF